MSRPDKKLPIHPVQKRDDYRCQYCGKDGLLDLDNWHDCSIDHFTPQKHGGTDDESNLKTSCHYCNAIKGDRLFTTIEEARAFIKKRRQELQNEFERVCKAVRG